MEEDCLISIIVPIYNVERYLNKCIDSIISQTYKNIEIILVDDGSPDNCGKICDEYAKKDNRIKVIHKENGGVSSARNVGIEISNGEWIVFVDADDWIEIEYCKRMLDIAIQRKADVVLCGYNRVVGSKKEKINSSGDNEEFDSIQYLNKILNPQTAFGFCHMKIIKKIVMNNIQFNEDLNVGEDALFNIMTSKNITKVIINKEALYNYRINMNSVVKKFDVKYPDKYEKSMKINRDYIWNNYYNHKDVLQNYYNFVAFHVLLIAVNYCYSPYNTNKKNELKEICDREIFKEAIKKCNYNELSFTRKVTLFSIKHHLYIITKIICIIRQKQNRKQGVS